MKLESLRGLHIAATPGPAEACARAAHAALRAGAASIVENVVQLADGWRQEWRARVQPAGRGVELCWSVSEWCEP